jgi:hypothetical protein
MSPAKERGRCGADDGIGIGTPCGVGGEDGFFCGCILMYSRGGTKSDVAKIATGLSKQ